MFLNQLVWSIKGNTPKEYQDKIVIPEALMVECFSKLCFQKEGDETYRPMRNRIVSNTNGSIVNDIFGKETYLLWQNVLVLRKNIYPFLQKVTKIDDKFKGDDDPARIAGQDENTQSTYDQNQDKIRILETKVT